MSLLWRTAVTGSDEYDFYAENPDEFDSRPYQVENPCGCEHVEHTQKATVGEGTHPLYGAGHQGNWEHPWVGPICDDCATGHLSLPATRRTG